MRRTAIALALTLAAANPANAQVMWLAEPIKTGLGTRFYDGPPPIRYVKEMAAPVLFVHPDNMLKACGVKEAPAGLRLVACARVDNNGVKWAILPHPCLSINEPFALVACHELAHVNSWPGDHPA